MTLHTVSSSTKPDPRSKAGVQQSSLHSSANGAQTPSSSPSQPSTFPTLTPSQIQAKIDASTADLSIMFNHPRIAAAYMDDWHAKASVDKVPNDAPEGVATVEKGCRDLRLRKVARFYHVESDYYDWTLQRRMLRLVAPSTAHLCKSVIMENTHFTQTDPTNSKYYCVIVQYVSKLNTQKLINFVYGMNQNKPDRKLSKKDFNLRVADESMTMEITGHTQNGVSPIGMKVQLPIILSGGVTILQPPVFYMGGGHIDWKLALPVHEFIHATKCFVVDTS
ncbi:proline---tRNA ligase [Synchytrium endobioticum]|uniref:Proline---tRNA ligase n=1 Tax=Synchytrium endobioticum TaxID=286115 RepID=A0A507CMV1_9FUNG|nr:proline---tRNA ligase [Synchytrium endobioticum]TPX42654.1 proline---tRNA ligase [Synchytrium endobioticum]